MKLCGRWAIGKGEVDKYVGIDLPLPDAKASYALAGSNGLCCYVVKDSMTNVVNKIFLTSVVGPNMTQVFGSDIGLLLSKALLFAALECPERVPLPIVS